MSHNIKTSICIMSYNAENTIEKCIHSCVNQLQSPSEIIIIDDCSIDKTPAIIEGLVAAYSGPIEFKFYRNSSNIGIAFNTKKIINMATGDLIYLVAGDDYVLNNFISSSIALLDDKENINNIFIMNNQYEELDNIRIHKKSTYNFSKSILNNAIRKNGSFIKCGISREILKDSEYLSNFGVWADWIWDVDIAVKNRNIKILHNNIPSYIHVGGVGVSSTTPEREILKSYLLSANYIYSKYGPKLSFSDKFYLLSEVAYFKYVIYGGFSSFVKSFIFFIFNIFNYNSLAGLKSASNRFFPLLKIKRLIFK